MDEQTVAELNTDHCVWAQGIGLLEMVDEQTVAELNTDRCVWAQGIGLLVRDGG